MQEFEKGAESGDQYNFMLSNVNCKCEKWDLLHFSSSTITDYSQITNP